MLKGVLSCVCVRAREREKDGRKKCLPCDKLSREARSLTIVFSFSRFGQDSLLPVPNSLLRLAASKIVGASKTEKQHLFLNRCQQKSN